MKDVNITRIDEDQIDTVIAADVEFSGEMYFKKPLLVYGKITGKLRSDSDIFIEEEAVVEANIYAKTVSVKGKVKGNILAKEKIELFSCSSVDGDVIAPQVNMESGCKFNGKCQMTSPNI